MGAVFLQGQEHKGSGCQALDRVDNACFQSRSVTWGAVLVPSPWVGAVPWGDLANSAAACGYCDYGSYYTDVQNRGSHAWGETGNGARGPAGFFPNFETDV
jgi:hypothetical protein